MRNGTLLIALLLGVFALSAAASDVYMWRDSDGVIHYGDKPLSEDAQRIEIVTTRTNREVVRERYEADQAQRTATSEEFQAERSTQQAARAAQELSASEKAAACESARERLKAYINARRLYRTDDSGKQVYLDSKEMDAARASAEANVAEKCR